MKLGFIAVTTILLLSLWSTIGGIAIAFSGCVDTTLFYVWQLNDVIGCIDDTLVNHETRITTLESSGVTETTDCINVGSGTQIIRDSINGDCSVRSIVGSGDISVTNSSNLIFIDFNGTSGGCGDLDCLSDVVIVNVDNNQVLRYNGTYWINTGTLYNITLDGTTEVRGNVNGTWTIPDRYQLYGQQQFLNGSESSIYFTPKLADNDLFTVTTSGGIIFSNSHWDGDSSEEQSYVMQSFAQNTNGYDTFRIIDTSTNQGKLQISNQGEFTMYRIKLNNTGLTAERTYTLPNSNGQILTTSSVINDLSDVIITSPSNNQVLTYSSGNWINKSPTVYQNNTASCVNPTGECIFAQKVGSDLQFKKLLGGTGISLSSNSTRITITNTLPESTVCTNLGSVGEGIYASGNCDFKKLLAGSSISLSSNGTRITITNTAPDDTSCVDLGHGAGDVYKDGECNFRGIASSTGISISQNTTDVIVTNTRPELQIGQTAFSVYSSLTKTNIGNAYVDIYVTAFDEEDMAIIDCNNVTRGRLTYIWDYVGTGTQQLRWVDASNNGNVFYESPTFTSDRDATDSGTFVKPSWCTGIVTLEQQGKSTVAGDDPVAKGYMVTLY